MHLKRISIGYKFSSAVPDRPTLSATRIATPRHSSFVHLPVPIHTFTFSIDAAAVLCLQLYVPFTPRRYVHYPIFRALP